MSNETLADSVFRKVRSDIRRQAITAGTVIVENDICRDYSVSKSTAGEVLHRLAGDGYLVSIPRRGYMLNTFSEKDFRDLQELRFAIEGLVIHKIINNVPNEDLKSLLHGIYDSDNYTFHMGLAKLAGDGVIAENLETLLTKANMTYGLLTLNSADISAIKKRHMAIVDALLTKNEQAAIDALRVDLRIDDDSPDMENVNILGLKEPFTTEKMKDIVYISDPQMSPDGNTAAWTEYKAKVEDGKFYSRIGTKDLTDGSESFIDCGNNCRALRFSPSGSFISYLSDASGEMQLCVRLPDGSEKQLTTARHGIDHYSIAPDEKSFCFEAKLWKSEIDSGAALTEMSADEKKAWLEERDWAPIEVTEIDYKRDECRGVRDGSLNAIGLVDLNGTQRLLVSDINYERPVFSPDGSLIACYGNPNKGPFYSKKELFTVNTATGEAKQLKTDLYLCGDAPVCFTEDGGSIVLSAYYFKDECSIVYLYKLPVEGGEPVCLFDPEAEEVSSGVYGMPCQRTQYGEEKPYFTVSGGMAYFVAAWQGKENLYKIGLEGGKTPRLIVGGTCVAEFCLPVNGKFLLTCGDSTTIRDLFIVDTVRATRTRLRDSNPWLSGCRLGKVSTMDVKSKDGKALIHGWVCRPADFSEGRKYPAVLYLHGGPTVTFTDDFWHEIQVLAGAGFAVVYCDPRGSWGYGLKHSDENCAWGTEAYDDMMTFLEHAVSLGFIDEDRLGITGGSYGGYMTCKIIMMDHRFRAAVGQRVFVNQATSYGTGDMGFYSARMKPEEVKIGDCLMKRSKKSIIRNMDKIDTPLLLLHGFNDYRCSFEQSEQMFISMHQRRPEVPVRLVMFPGENHAVSRTGLLHFQQRHVREMTDWFVKYLKEDAENEEKK